MWTGYSASIEPSRHGLCRRIMPFQSGVIKAELRSWNGLWFHKLLFRRRVFLGQLIKRLSLTFYWILPLCSFSGSARINPSLWSRRLQFAGRAELLTCWIANETLRRCCLNHPDFDWAQTMNVVVFSSGSMAAGGHWPLTSAADASLQRSSLWTCSLIW